MINFNWLSPEAVEKNQHEVNVVVDIDWAGCQKTRCSTSGGIIIYMGSPLKHWCVTQPTISLSGAETEAKAMTKGAIEAIYVKHHL